MSPGVTFHVVVLFDTQYTLTRTHAHVFAFGSLVSLPTYLHRCGRWGSTLAGVTDGDDKVSILGIGRAHTHKFP